MPCEDRGCTSPGGEVARLSSRSGPAELPTLDPLARREARRPEAREVDQKPARTGARPRQHGLRWPMRAQHLSRNEGAGNCGPQAKPWSPLVQAVVRLPLGCGARVGPSSVRPLWSVTSHRRTLPKQKQVQNQLQAACCKPASQYSPAIISRAKPVASGSTLVPRL